MNILYRYDRSFGKDLWHIFIHLLCFTLKFDLSLVGENHHGHVNFGNVVSPSRLLLGSFTTRILSNVSNICHHLICHRQCPGEALSNANSKILRVFVESSLVSRFFFATNASRTQKKELTIWTQTLKPSSSISGLLWFVSWAFDLICANGQAPK